MSQEEAYREAQRKDEEAIAAAQAEEERQRTASWGSMRRRSTLPPPPAPNYQPPPPPNPSSSRSPEAEMTIEKAEQEMRRAGGGEEVESGLVERTLKTISPGPGQTVLPVVEETEGEDRRSGGSREGSTREVRPLTPAKDDRDGYMDPRFGRLIAADRGELMKAPPTPPKTGHGYGGDGRASGDYIDAVGGKNGGLRSVSGSMKLGRDSLDKALPPLPTG